MNDNFHPSVTWDVPISERDVKDLNIHPITEPYFNVSVTIGRKILFYKSF